MLYTRKGDSGTSGLFGTKVRLPKTDHIFVALGTLDELNSLLGICRAHAAGIAGDQMLSKEIRAAQEALFIIQAELAGSDKRIEKARVDALEGAIDGIEALIGNPKAFTIPGTTITSAYLDYARAVTRRAERCANMPDVQRRLSSQSLAYLNRLSSLLYALARFVAAKDGVKEPSPTYS